MRKYYTVVCISNASAKMYARYYIKYISQKYLVLKCFKNILLSTDQCFIYRHLLEGNFSSNVSSLPLKCAEPIYVLLPLLQRTSTDGMLITVKSATREFY